jgi:rhodanese-related sulfurtransferase
METDRNLLLLDVRSNGERQHSHIKGSLHIPLNQLVSRSDELSKHKEKEIVCYCQTGNRSVTAASRLNKLGFKAANLKGGIAEWNFQNRA